MSDPWNPEEYIDGLSREILINEIERLQVECERLRGEVEYFRRTTCACRYTLAMELETECDHHRKKRQEHERYKQMILSAKRSLEESEKPFYKGMDILNQLQEVDGE